MNQDKNVLYEVDGRHVAYLTLNKLDIHNAFDDGMIASLIKELKEAEANKSLRALVLTGAGDSFSAGADLRWMKKMADYSKAENERDAGQLADLLWRLYSLHCPVIACVNGPAYGGGVGLAACADIVIAHEGASFCLSEVKLGLVPALISPYVIAAIGKRQAQRYFLTAERFSAAEAQAMGLVHVVTSRTYLQDEVEKFVELLLKSGPSAVRHCKKMIHHVADESVEEKLAKPLIELIAELRVSTEGQEGMKAFFEKRAPSWQM